MMTSDKDDLLARLRNLYNLLNNEGFSGISVDIKNLIYSLETDDEAKFKKYYSSSQIWGGSGSIFDIDFRDSEKNRLRNESLECLKRYKGKFFKPFWKFW